MRAVFARIAAARPARRRFSFTPRHEGGFRTNRAPTFFTGESKAGTCLQRNPKPPWERHVYSKSGFDLWPSSVGAAYLCFDHIAYVCVALYGSGRRHYRFDLLRESHLQTRRDVPAVHQEFALYDRYKIG